MRVLLICTVYPPENAPAGIMTQDLAEDLATCGTEVRVLTGYRSEAVPAIGAPRRRPGWHCAKENGVSVVRVWHTVLRKESVPSRILYWLTFAVSSFACILFSRKYDVVYAHSTPLFGAPLTWLASRIRGSTFVYGIYDVYPEAVAEVNMMSRGIAYRCWRRMDTAICRRATCVPTLSQGMRDTLLLRGLSAARIPVIPFWLDARKFPLHVRDNAWRQAQGIAQDTFVALYAGTIGHISGADVMIDVAERMQDEQRLLFLFVGEGVAKSRLVESARERRLANVRFLPFQPASCLGEMQGAADIGIVTLRPGAGRNSIPSKVLGYMAAGRAVLASVDADSDTADCIGLGQCGIVVPPGDAAAIARAIRELMEGERSRSLGNSARAHFLAAYDRGRGTSRYIEILHEACQQKKKRRVGVTPLGKVIPLAPYRPVKRLLDAMGAISGLAITAVLMLLTAGIVKLTSKGPVLYADERLGVGGKAFRMYKFRSMKHNAPPVLTEGRKLIVTKHDPRLSPVGGLIRGLKIDELPQLFNVLRGDMSIVGPRAGRPSGEARYTEAAYARLRVKPGLTGLGAVLGGRHLANDSLYDIEARYVGVQNLWLDFLIMLLTPLYIVAGPRWPRRLLYRYTSGLSFDALGETRGDR